MSGRPTGVRLGALLRREGLYSSHLVTWRAARDRGELTGLERKRGPVPQIADPRNRKIAELEREAARWRNRAERAEALVAVASTVDNTEHHHTGLGLLTPHDVHHGLAEQRVAARTTVLATAYAAHPERFPSGRPPAPQKSGSIPRHLHRTTSAKGS